MRGLPSASPRVAKRVGYRLAVSNSEGRFLVEQQAYLSAGSGEAEEKIAWMRVLCSGFRPLEASQASSG